MSFRVGHAGYIKKLVTMAAIPNQQDCEISGVTLKTSIELDIYL